MKSQNAMSLLNAIVAKRPEYAEEILEDFVEAVESDCGWKAYRNEFDLMRDFMRYAKVAKEYWDAQ